MTYNLGSIYFKINKYNPNVEIYANYGPGIEKMTKIDF